MEFLATIRPAGEKFRAQLLFANSLMPVEFFRQTEHWDELAEFLVTVFDGISLVTPERFQMELDHIHLFGTRWDMPTDRYSDRFAASYTDRMSDEDILHELNKADDLLIDLQEKFNAVLSSSNLEDSPRTNG